MKPVYEKFTFRDAPDFKRELLAAVAAGDRTVDLSGVAAADSSMLSVLMAARRRASDLKVVAAPAALIELARLYGTAELAGLGEPASASGAN